MDSKNKAKKSMGSGDESVSLKHESPVVNRRKNGMAFQDITGSPDVHQNQLDKVLSPPYFTKVSLSVVTPLGTQPGRPQEDI
jgi:hypothetical protein